MQVDENRQLRGANVHDIDKPHGQAHSVGDALRRPSLLVCARPEDHLDVHSDVACALPSSRLLMIPNDGQDASMSPQP
jgi:hypothetical protein